MAVTNTRKLFHFILEINGVDQAEIQRVTLPTLEVAETTHGEGNTLRKTPGLLTTGDLVLAKVKPSAQSDTFAWNWLTTVQDPATGGGGNYRDYARTVVLREVDNTGVRTINRWIMTGVWAKRIEHTELDRTSSDNMVETLTLSVHRCEKI